MCLSTSIFAQVDKTIEAEDATLSGNYEIQNNTNASNGIFIKSLNTNPNGTLELNVNNIITAGTYKVEVFYFNGGITQNADISINGNTSTTITLQPSNWAYQGEAKSTLLDINLLVGDNTITFSTPQATVLFDKFRITDNFNAYYISNSGDDSNDGSINAPWKTIEKANEVTEKLSNGGLLVPGDKLLFKSGDTFYGHFNVKCSGTVEKPIEISNYGPGEKPIFSGSGGTITGGDWFEAILLTNTSNLLVNNLWVKNDRKDGSRYTWGEYNSYGIKLVANKWGGVASNIIFRDLKISDVFGITIPPPSEFNSLNATGIRFEADANEVGLEIAIKDVLIEDCYFTHIGKAGVWAIHKGTKDPNDDAVNRNQQFIIRNNHFQKTGGSGVILSNLFNGLIENNNFDQTGYSNGVENRLAGRGSGAWVFGCRNIVAQYNKSYSVRGPGDSYGMHIDFGNKNILFQYNYSEDSEGGFCEILGDNYNCAYRFNVSLNDGFRDFHGYTLWISGYAGSGNTPIRSDENYIYNNTIFLNKNYTPRISIFAKNTYVYNNIFMALNGAKIGYDSAAQGAGVSIDVGNGNFSMENNLFEGDIHTNFKNEAINSQTGDPLFTAQGITLNKEGYILQTGSPAIDNGKSFPEPSFPMAGIGIFENVSLYPTFDTFGVAVDIQNAVPNIGASNIHNTNNALGIEDYENTENMFTLYPNPVINTINLKCISDIQSTEAVIYDIQSRLIYSTSVQVVQGNAQIKLPENIRNGIYFLRIVEGTKSQTSQFILYR